jgi:8-oxo-dGTP diphosphatase
VTAAAGELRLAVDVEGSEPRRPVDVEGSEPRRPVDVAVGVLIDREGRFLLTSRPEGKVYAGYWEFPGGKIEPGEAPAAAIARELHEELGIDIGPACPWITRVFEYPHGTVHLRFFRIFDWKHEPHAREGQDIGWQTLDALVCGPMLPANAPVLASLALPWEYAVTNAAQVGVPAMLAQLERRLKAGLRLVQVREPALPEPAAFTRQVIELAHRHGARVLTKIAQPGADGVHFTAAQLMALEARPRDGLAAASCHTREELEHAMRLGLDFAVLGSVKDKAALGWQKFAELARDASIPVYAIGGLLPADLPDARRAGAHGLAMIRGAWR